MLRITVILQDNSVPVQPAHALRMMLQAMSKLKEPKIVLKVRKADMPLLKENLDSIKSKFKKVCSALSPCTLQLRTHMSKTEHQPQGHD